LFVIETDNRAELIEYLKKHDIETKIHYPQPPHLAQAYENLGYKEGDFPVTEAMANRVLSLPLYNDMTDEEISYVIDVVNQY
jgi:dTDP-4-amino-4,6-dideoxygalactose transaminase